MDRDIFSTLLKWKKQASRKPLILRGARQVGKTHLLKTFGETVFSSTLYVNFEERPKLKSLFKDDLTPKRIISDLSLIYNQTVIPEETLIIFDEIQACPNAISSLKYFNETGSHYYITAAGSLLGVIMGQERGYPVGQVQTIDLYPLSFFEFLNALGQPELRKRLETANDIPEAIHEKCLSYLRTYMITGGLPEVIQTYLETKSLHQARSVQNELLNGYHSDFAKYSDPSTARRVLKIWQSIPAQLGRENKKFQYALIEHNARSREFESALLWLVNAGLITLLYRAKTPYVPLRAYIDHHYFKSYFFDTGLLGALCGLEAKLTLEKDALFRFYKGAIAENFVMQELKAADINDIAYWTSNGQAEVDIIIAHEGSIYPLEVKSGYRHRSKSMATYSKKFNPKMRLYTSQKNRSINNDQSHYPLYQVSELFKHPFPS